MTLPEVLAELERRRAEAVQDGSLAPVGRVLERVLDLLRQLDGTPAPARLVTTAEAAGVLGTVPKTVARWCGAGRFPGARKTSGERGEWRIPLDAVYAVLGRPRPSGRETVRLWRDE